MRPYNCNCFFETKTKQLEKRNEKLLEQNRELVEALTNSAKVISTLKILLTGEFPVSEITDYLHTASAYQNVIEELLTKHSKDV